MYHLRPVMIHSSPLRMMLVLMLRASELATAGSVIAKHDRMVPSNSGRR